MTQKMSFLHLIIAKVKMIRMKRVKRASMNLDHASKIFRTYSLKRGDQPHQSMTLKMVPATNQIKLLKRDKQIS